MINRMTVISQLLNTWLSGMEYRIPFYRGNYDCIRGFNDLKCLVQIGTATDMSPYWGHGTTLAETIPNCTRKHDEIQ